MARNLWQRILGRRERDLVDREIEERRGSAEDRRIATESVEDYASDEAVAERLGGIEPSRLEEDDRPPL